MSLTTKVLTSAVVALAIVLGLAVYVDKTTPQPATQEAPKSGATNVIVSNSFCFGGVCRYSYSIPLTQGASTTCNFQTPAATSTLLSANVRFDLASTAAATVDIGRSKGPMATTTLIGTTYNIGASAAAYIVASTSPAAGDATVFGPSNWFAVKIGSGGVLSAPTGTCNATFEVSL